jgi:hypothetical protein
VFNQLKIIITGYVFKHTFKDLLLTYFFLSYCKDLFSGLILEFKDKKAKKETVSTTTFTIHFLRIQIKFTE